jgi:hypothetical protein
VSCPTYRGIVLLLAVAAAACADGDPGLPAWLREATDRLPADPVAEAWGACSYRVPEIVAPGVAWLDADADGDLDILQLRMPLPATPAAPSPNRLLLQEADGRFAPALESGLEDPGFAQGVAVGDVDADGHLDVFVANHGPDALLRGDGAGRFRDASGGQPFTLDSWSSGATFCDVDADGDLDLYVVRYLDFSAERPCAGPSGRRDYCSPESFNGLRDSLYLNDGAGRFTDGSRAVGLRYADDGRRAKGLAVLCTDFTDDGRLDFYVANDGEPNQLWVQQADGTLRDEAVIRGLAVNRFGRPEGSMGLTVGDVDADGGLDLFVTHIGNENNTLYGDGPGDLYRDRTSGAGMETADWNHTGFGTGFVDLDHDGDCDLVVVNGRVRRGERHAAAGPGPWADYAEPNALYLNDGTGRFRNAPDRAGPFGRHVEISRGLALGDVDRDGDADLLVSHHDGSLRLFLNDAPAPGTHWLRLRLLEADGREALGARVTLEADGKRRSGWFLRGYGYQSSHEPEIHFGLGATDAVDAVEVRWPDGGREGFAVAGVDRTVTLRRGEGAPP